MKRIVSLLHRQAVKAKAEGLFFKVGDVAVRSLHWQVTSLNLQVSTLELFNCILAHQKDLPRERPYMDLLHLINFVLRKFFKTMEEQPLLMLEVIMLRSFSWLSSSHFFQAFFPKNRGAWKQYSTWKPLIGQSAKAERVGSRGYIGPESCLLLQ